jgi:hypothetical protein
MSRRREHKQQAGRTLSIKVFVSYAHRDERLRQELDKHLSALRRSAIIESWCDREISPGSDFGREIDRQMKNSHLVLLLISPDFMNSDYCYGREMRAALRRHARGEARVIPIILRPVDWLRSPIGKLQALPKDAKPVTSWHKRDEALLDVAKGVWRVAEEMGARHTPARASLAIRDLQGSVTRARARR